MAELMMPNPVGSYMKGQQFRTMQQREGLEQQGMQQRFRLMGNQEHRSQESHEMNQKVQEWELKMRKDEHARKEEIYKFGKAASGLLSVLEAPEEQQAALFERVYPMLDDEAKSYFPNGQYDPNAAMTLAKTAVSVLDRLKLISNENKTSASAEARRYAADKSGETRLDAARISAQSRENAAKIRAEGKSKGTLKTSDYNLIRKSVADIFNATFDEKTNSIIGLSTTDRAQYKRIEALASRIYKDADGELTHAEAAIQAAEEHGYGEFANKPGNSAQKDEDNNSVKSWLERRFGPK